MQAEVQLLIVLVLGTAIVAVLMAILTRSVGI